MDDLVAFVRTRIGEERADAEATTGWWPPAGLKVLDDMARVAWYSLTPNQARHIKRQDPAATLARCDADEHEIALCEQSIRAPEVENSMEVWLAKNLLLAKVRRYQHLDHPDFNPEWAA